MKVLIASAYFESHRGGIEIVAGCLAREMQRQGAEVTWMATDDTLPPVPNSGSGVSVPIRAWNITERRLGVPMPLPGPGGVATIWRAVKATDVVLLHDSLYLTNVVALLSAHWHRKPVVITQHIAAVPYRNPLLRGLMAAANAVIARPMLAGAEQVVFISETVKAGFGPVRYKSAPRLIFNGVDTNVFRVPPPKFDRDAARASLGLPARNPVALFVGRFVEKKGLHFIAQLALRRTDLTFALAGWGPLDPRAWGLPNVQVLSGLQGPSLASLYQASDVLILPSIGEGFPLVLQEALACGLPVICGKETAGADTAAAQLLASVEIDAANIEATVGALTQQIDKALAETAGTGRAATAEIRRAYVVSRYSWNLAAAAYLSTFADCLAPTLADQ